MGKGKLAKALARERSNAKELKKKEDAVKRKAEVEKQKRAKNQAMQKRPALIPFKTGDKALLVGEGDFSFACSILKNKLINKVTATCLDTEAEVKEKYPNSAPDNLSWLAENGAEVLFEIDGTKLHNTKPFSSQLGTFDSIIFNFPHCGNSIKDQHRNILQHQKLMVAFFESSRKLIKPRGGRIVVTLFEGEPYISWNIKKLAQTKDLRTLISNEFKWSAFPGYSHRLTAKEGNTSKPQASRPSRIYIFSNKDDPTEWNSKQQPKDNVDSPSDDEL
jgi:25S rRNA (uracil2634-N3)-methyltransferase